MLPGDREGWALLWDGFASAAKEDELKPWHQGLPGPGAVPLAQTK